MADNRLFSPPGVVAMGNALSSRMSRPNLSCVSWTDARRPVPRLWIRSAEVQGRGGGAGGRRSDNGNTTTSCVSSFSKLF